MVRCLAAALGFALIAAQAGCSDDTAPSGAAGSTGTGGACADEPTAPAEPAPAALAPCPRGWREVAAEEGGVVTCDPWPETGRETCGIDEAHFPGEPGCARIGTACSSGSFADGLPASGVLYALAGALPGGDGSLAAPFATIGEAMAVAIGGDVIALGKGTYDEVVDFAPGVTLWGACVADTLVTSSVPSPPPGPGTLNIDVPDAGVKNLRLAGQRAALVIGGTGTSAELDDVVVDGATDFAIVFHSSAQVTGENIVVRNTQPTIASGKDGDGIYAIHGAIAVLTRVALEHNTSSGVFTVDAADVTLKDVVVADTQPRPADGLGGEALFMQGGGLVHVSGGTLERSHQAAVFVRDADSAVGLEDVVLSDTSPEEATSQHGFGMDLIQGATATVARVLVKKSRKVGILVEDEGTDMSGEDLVIQDTQRQASDDDLGVGLMVQSGAHAALSRVLVHRSFIAGALAFDGTLEIDDLTVLDVGDDEPTEATAAVGGTDGATVTLHRALLERSRRAGILFQRGAALVAEDVVVRDLLGDTLSGDFGRGLQTNDGASVQITRGLFQRARDLAVASYASGSSIELTDVVIEDTLERACVETSCAGEGRGIGIGAYEGGSIRATRFAVRSAAFCGVQVATGGLVELHRGEVMGNPIGANVQDPAFDVSLLQDCVRYHDNERSLDAELLPLPPVGDSLP